MVFIKCGMWERLFAELKARSKLIGVRMWPVHAVNYGGERDEDAFVLFPQTQSLDNLPRYYGFAPNGFRKVGSI